MNGEEAARKAIFHNYSKVMKYVIHKEDRGEGVEKGEEGGEGKPKKKTFSIIKNLAITIPGIK